MGPPSESWYHQDYRRHNLHPRRVVDTSPDAPLQPAKPIADLCWHSLYLSKTLEQPPWIVDVSEAFPAVEPSCVCLNHEKSRVTLYCFTIMLVTGCHSTCQGDGSNATMPIKGRVRSVARLGFNNNCYRNMRKRVKQDRTFLFFSSIFEYLSNQDQVKNDAAFIHSLHPVFCVHSFLYLWLLRP
ncbi:Uncharacterized protein HZ326_15983 [Fusarium oxysporum f. sp. albedinis]|nr:Uncharacterized protein HZ326_15983 [Fusarium oxysporum f. sp. albedinis]